MTKKESIEIAKRLKLESAPHETDYCLNCHATNPDHERWAIDREVGIADGVGCESCHGPAEQWLAAHQLPQWRWLSAESKSSLGFVNTDNLYLRATTCIPCHVGAPGRDVNHDLIAAGHPRLNFEMSAYQSRLPRHWSRSKDLQINSAELESKTWLIGQILSASSALDQLANRAADSGAPWPEFAEFACASCHHELRPAAWNEDLKLRRRELATPRWGTWYFAQFDEIMSFCQALGCMRSVPIRLDGEFDVDDRDFLGPPDSSFANFKSALEVLKREMQSAIPDRRKTEIVAREIRQELSLIAANLCGRELREQDRIALSRLIFQRAIDDAAANWDFLTQQYLAAVAFRQSALDAEQSFGRGRVDPSASRNRLLSVRERLKFIQDHNGPQHLDREQTELIHRAYLEIFGLAETSIVP